MNPSREGTWAVVVNWNGGEENLACLASLVAAGVSPAHTVFVDNASSDGSREAVVARHPELVLFENPSNLGYGAAANRGARAALEGGAEAVLFLNNDATLVGEALGQLLAVLAEKPRVGMVGPRILLPGEPARVWAAGGRVVFGPNLSVLRGNGALDGPQWRGTVEVDYLPGCALLARRESLEEVGLFDDAYFAYLEDVDLGERARRGGWQSWCVGEALCLHAASSATGGGYTARRKYLNALNSLRFLRSHGTPGRWSAFLLCDVLAWPLTFLAALPTGRGRAAAAKGLGILHGLLGRRASAETMEAGGTVLW